MKLVSKQTQLYMKFIQWKPTGDILTRANFWCKSKAMVDGKFGPPVLYC